MNGEGHLSHGRVRGEDLNEVSEAVIGAAIEVHDHLGPSLLERAYEQALSIELDRQEIPFASETELPLRYRDRELDESYRLDLLVDDRLVVEIKAVSDIQRVHRAQLLTYLSLGDHPLGLLINFHEPTLVEGVHRMAL